MDTDGLTRRRFLTVLGTGAAAVACNRPPKEEIRPYVHQPELTPGEPLHFATSMTIDGIARGLLVKSLDARPIKVDAHPEHPTSLGSSSVFEQAAIRSLYDPRRLQVVRNRDQVSSWDAFFSAFSGGNVTLLLDPTSSPMTAELLTKLPGARVFFDAPFTPNSPIGLKMSTGVALLPRPKVDDARVILLLDSDLCGADPYSALLAKGLADGRRRTPVNRVYAIEPTLTLSGIAADHRLSVRPSQVATAARWLVAKLRNLPEPDLSADAKRFLTAVLRDLQANRGASYVGVGEHREPALHALAHALNDILENVGKTVTYAPSPIIDHGGESHDLEALIVAMERGEIAKLLVLGGDPAYANPRFRTAMGKVPLVGVLADHVNVTSEEAHWVLPRAHFLESWGDGRAADGTITLTQPLIEPLYGGKTVDDVLAGLAKLPPQRPLERLRAFHEGRGVAWNESVRRGFVADSAFSTVDPPAATIPREEPPPPHTIELQVRPDARLHDGRFATNEWLLELPDPVTKQTWGNAALVSPAFAAENGLETGRVIGLKQATWSVEVPVIVVPGHADGTITLTAGWGAVAKEGRHILGANAFLLANGPVEFAAQPRSERLAITQTQASQEHAEVAVEGKTPEHEEHRGLHEPPTPEGPQWGMAIDLNACLGCSACMVACQAENNVAVVGRENVLKSREMHWIRIDRYFEGDRAIVQPMLCQHCEKAPCEYVCPVNATTHSPDGINEMTYNRCVGTRFCSNNCAWKVRRFNWLDYRRREAPVLALGANPNVTVRARGVMEKCTFCVQRLRGAEIRARRENKPIGSIPVDVACAEACPTKAITFGNLAQEDSAVAKLAKHERAYVVFEELGTRPRVRYLARTRNPNPELGS